MDVFDLGDIFFCRTLEQLLGEKLSGILIYLGYRLSLHLPVETIGELKWSDNC